MHVPIYSLVPNDAKYDVTKRFKTSIALSVRSTREEEGDDRIIVIIVIIIIIIVDKNNKKKKKNVVIIGQQHQQGIQLRLR